MALISASFVTEIGNGVHTIAVAFLLHQLTNSVLAFALVLSGDFIIRILMQFLAGSATDRGNPRQMMIGIDIARGLGILLAVVGTVAGMGVWPIILSLVLLKVAGPFYRTANFALVSNAVAEDRVAHVNALTGSGGQTGQLLGTALVGPLILWFGPLGAFAAGW
jgi:MFS family permease